MEPPRLPGLGARFGAGIRARLRPQLGQRFSGLAGRLGSFLRQGDPWVQGRVLVLLALGWLLSPLCWWNDLVINLPLAYGFARLIQLWHPEWFMAALGLGYWFSNVLGLVLMQTSAVEVFSQPGQPGNLRREILLGLASSTLFTLAVLVLVQLGWIQAPLGEALGNGPDTVLGAGLTAAQ